MSESRAIGPLRGNVLVEMCQPEEKTAGGLLLPMKITSPINEVIVVSVGPDVKSVKVGELVLIPHHSGTEIEKDRIIVPEEEILGVVEEV